MLRLPSTETVPPPSTWQTKKGPVKRPGFSYYVEETDHIVDAKVWRDLVGRVLSHMRANDVPEGPDIEARIMDAICRHSETECEGWSSPKWRDTFAMIKRFVACAVTYITRAARRGEKAHVEQEEAERRAAICVRCTNNAVVKCIGCAPLRSLVARIIGDRRVSVEDRLESCRICLCENKSQVWVSGGILAKCSSGLDYPEHVDPGDPGSPACWKRM